MEDNMPRYLSLCQPCNNNRRKSSCELATGATTLYRLRCLLDAIQLKKALESQRNRMKLVRFAVDCILSMQRNWQRGDHKLCSQRRLILWKSDAVGFCILAEIASSHQGNRLGNNCMLYLGSADDPIALRSCEMMT